MRIPPERLTAARHPDRGVRLRSRPILVTLVGFVSLVWFLVRVAPKPARAAYPCQRAAFPLATGFVFSIAGLIGSAFIYRKGMKFLRQSRWGFASASLAVAVVMGIVTLVSMPDSPVLADPRIRNDPIGLAKGIHPGRVVWVHDPDATDWEGPGYGHWWESDHTSQVVVDQMLASAIRRLSGETDDSTAWDRIIRHFNQTHGKGDVGYEPGEKIVIKVNFVGCHYMWGGVDPDSYDMITNRDYMNTSPQMILALLRQLVYAAGVSQADISIGDPSALFPNEYYDMCHTEFPNVHYLDHNGGNPSHPRTAVQYSTVPLYWSSHPTGVAQDYVPVSYAEAEYFIDMANFKSHSSAGVTLCAKNHYGSLIHNPNASGYYNMHLSLATFVPAPGSYRALVDLLGHAHTGGKALLYLVDGLYSGVHVGELLPRKWDFPPFNGDWTSCIFVSQDPLSLDSVCFDFLQEEGDSREYPQMAGADDYLHEAALADSPPSGTFYDPDHDGDVVRLASLGVHEHWNNSTDMQYSRNLGTGDGIELVIAGRVTAVADAAPIALPAPVNYPNPFNPETEIRFAIPARSKVCVDVYDIRGSLVRRLLEGDTYPAGNHSVHWDGGDETGSMAPAGVYFCRVRADGIEAVRKMILLK